MAEASSVGSTATTQMKIMFVLAVVSFALEVVAVIQYFGGYTPAPIVLGGMTMEMPSISLFSTGIKGILCVVCAISALVPALGAAVVFFTHAFPSVVLLGSQQMTNEIRAKQSKPFQIKYLNFILGAIHIAAGVLGFLIVSDLGGGMWTPTLLSLIAGGCMIINVGLTFMHFAQPGVPQSLSLEYGRGGGGSSAAADARIAEMEKKMEELAAKAAQGSAA